MKKLVSTFNIALVFLIIGCVLTSVLIANTKLKVIANGVSLGHFESRESFNAIVSKVEKKAELYLGHPYVLNADLQYKLDISTDGSLASGKATEDVLFASISEITTADVLRVDGEMIGAVTNKAELEQLLDNMLQEYASTHASSSNSVVRFVEDLQIEQETIATKYVYSLENMKELLTSSKSHVETIISNQYSLHSLKHDTSIDTPTQDTQDFQPFLTIEEIVEETYTEKIPFTTEEIKTDRLYANNKQVKVHGKNGEKSVTVSVVYQNGVEVSSVIISETVTTQPVTQVIYIGTASPENNSAVGTFARPQGKLSSNYGYRGDEFHTGVDFASPKGTSITAAQNGVISAVFSNGGYGNYVIIDHGDGVQTLYAHCTRILVNEGDTVTMGQTIATVGNTGRSSGNHLHFEVRLNGEAVNPWTYIN